MYTCTCTGHHPLAGGAGQDQEREEMTLSPPPLLVSGDQSVPQGEGLVLLDAGLAHGCHDDHLIIAQGGLHLVGGPGLPRDGRQGDGNDQGPLVRGRGRRRRRENLRRKRRELLITCKVTKVTQKSDKSPCTIVQGHEPNFAKIKK